MAGGGLSQEDFRKLLATPRPDAKPASQGEGAAADGFAAPAQKKKKKKWEKLTKEEQAALAKRKEEEKALREKYRDRAKERRKGENRDYADHESLLDAYKNAQIAPSVEDSQITAEEKRLRDIEESKFLGGDVEHTHLVKGLDYALLQKLRSEREAAREAAEEEAEAELEVVAAKPKVDPEKSEKVTFRTKVGRGVYDVLFTTTPPKLNELFAPGRMAYLVDLEDKTRHSLDAPTTVIRSKADVGPVKVKTMSNNDIVLGKLCQILSYLRQGTRPNKRKKVVKKKVKTDLTSPSSIQKPSTEKAGPARGMDSDIDIFGNSASSSSTTNVSAAQLLKSGSKSYFEGSPKSKSEEKKRGEPPAEEGPETSLGPSAPVQSDPSLDGVAGPLPPTAETSRERVEAPVLNPSDSEDDGVLPLVLSGPVGKLNRKERRRGITGKKKRKIEADDEYAAYYPGGKEDANDGYDLASDEEREEIRVENKAMAKGKNKPSRSEARQKLNNDLSAINKFIEKRKAEKEAKGGAAKKPKAE